MGVLTRGGVALAIALTLVSFRGCHLEAQQPSAPQLVAAFLLNFVKFTTWPEASLPAGARIVICVLDDDRVADALTQITIGKSVSGHPIEVRGATRRSVPSGCQMVYSGDLDRRRARQLIEVTSGLPILTVGVSSDFAELGGVANFFVDSGRMRFAVNTRAADRSQLRISSKLLSLARIVQHDGPA